MGRQTLVTTTEYLKFPYRKEPLTALPTVPPFHNSALSLSFVPSLHLHWACGDSLVY